MQSTQNSRYEKRAKRGLLLGAVLGLVIAAIALCPGVYSSVNIYGAYRGWRGYSMDQLPSYDQL